MYNILSSLVSYVFITTIYVFILSIIRMIYKDIRNLSTQETYIIEQNSPILRVIDAPSGAYTSPRTSYPLTSKKITVGRAKSCDIVIDDMAVSKKHFQLWFEDKEWHIKDLKSKNGTRLNATSIDEPYLLDDGDKIIVGEITLEFSNA